MMELVFFLEEPSAAEMLDGLLPRMLPEGITWRMIVFEGKQDLEKRIVKRMRGYLNPNARFIVMRDKDSADCVELKKNLRLKCNEAGKPEALVRIICHELESWYLADLAAVEKGLGVEGLVKLQLKSLLRNPDEIANPFQELQRIVPSYQKISGSRAIGPYLDLENSRSTSFQFFISGIQRVIAEG